ncbi:MAG TPA: nucleoside hydrolase [Planctomycetota bacterium]|jgi:inosine-uridine nucleoside N-ribohydrolase
MRRLAFVLSILGLLAPVFAAENSPIPVVLDTDIGDDIDDTWALCMLLKSPQFDLKLVTTTYGKNEYRGKLLAKLLMVAGRTDVPVGLGAGGKTGSGGQQEWIKDYKLADYPGKVHEDGVKALVELINTSKRPITIIAIGPLQTLGAALEMDPGIAAKANLAAMQGSVRKGYDGNKTPCPEWNVKAGIAQAKRVFSAPWKQAVITPLDTCGLVKLAGPRMQTLRECKDELTQALLENYRIWKKKTEISQLTESSILFDTVAVYLADTAPRTLTEIESLKIAVDDKGMTLISPEDAQMGVATSWKDLDGYKDLLVKILTSPTVKK